MLDYLRNRNTTAHAFILDLQHFMCCSRLWEHACNFISFDVGKLSDQLESPPTLLIAQCHTGGIHCPLGCISNFHKLVVCNFTKSERQFIISSGLASRQAS